MTGHLELIGFESKYFFELKDSIAEYLHLKDLQYSIIASPLNKMRLATLEQTDTAIRFKNQLVFFPQHKDIKIGLSRLHHLLHKDIHGEKKTCLNCANCRCQNKSVS